MSKKETTNPKKIKKKLQKEKRENLQSISTSAFSGIKNSEKQEEEIKQNLQNQNSGKMVKIIKAQYKQELDLLILEVSPMDENGIKIENKNNYKMTLRFKEIKRAYNIKANVPLYLIQKFCKDLEGKVKTLKSLGVDLPDKDKTKDMSAEELQNVSASFWHQYPCWETYLLENSE